MESELSIGSFLAPAEEWENKSMIVKDDNQFCETQDFTHRSRDDQNGQSDVIKLKTYFIYDFIAYIWSNPFSQNYIEKVIALENENSNLKQEISDLNAFIEVHQFTA